MITCVIIEDDANTVGMLASIITQEFDTIKVLGDASTVIDGIQLIRTTTPDFIFLDVNLDDGKSFEILTEFPNPTFKIIFITSYSKYAVDAFKFSALDFVLKPFSPDEIISAIKKVIEYQNAAHYTQKIHTFFHNYNSSQKKLVLSNADSINIVAIDTILYAKSDNSYTTFYTNDAREILVSKSLKHFEEQLSPYWFFRIHQQYLVNSRHIKKYDKRNDVVLLSNAVSLPVAQSKKAGLLNILSN